MDACCGRHDVLLWLGLGKALPPLKAAPVHMLPPQRIWGVGTDATRPHNRSGPHAINENPEP
jgi:hypothetical protein